MKVIEQVNGQSKVKYLCQRCGYSTSTKCVLIAHLQRKNMCLPLNKVISTNEQLDKLLHKGQFKCDTCLKFYKTALTLKRHSCYEKTKEPVIAKTVTNDEPEPAEQPEPEVILNDMMAPRIDYINEDEILNMADFGGNIYPILAEKIFFNPDHPENHVIVIKNLERGEAYVFKNKQWEQMPISQTLSLVVTVIRSHIHVLLMTHMNEHNKLLEDYDTVLRDFENDLRNDPRCDKTQINRIVKNKIAALDNVIDKSNYVKNKIHGLYMSITHKKPHYYAKFLKAIKTKLINFNNDAREKHNNRHPITNQLCVHVNDWLEKEVERRLIARGYL